MEAKVGSTLAVLYILTTFTLTTTSSVKREIDALRCRECHEVASPGDCDRVAMCGDGEICFTRQFQDKDGEVGYHLGCEERARCDLYISAQTLHGVLLGKRESNDLDLPVAPAPRQLCYQCCTEDNCNPGLCLDSLGNHGGQHGPSSGKCPVGFLSGKTGCYYIANWSVDWNSARTDCKRRGADLVSVDSVDEHNYLVSKLQAMNSTTHPTYGYWTGGYYVMAMREWHWLDMHKVDTFTQWGPSQPSTTGYEERIAMINPYKYPTFKNWSWQSTKYSISMGFICERGFL